MGNFTIFSIFLYKVFIRIVDRQTKYILCQLMKPFRDTQNSLLRQLGRLWWCPSFVKVSLKVTDTTVNKHNFDMYTQLNLLEMLSRSMLDEPCVLFTHVAINVHFSFN